VKNIVIAWIITSPASGLIAGVLYFIVKLLS
jgi:phosphate/sulfate permease